MPKIHISLTKNNIIYLVLYHIHILIRNHINLCIMSVLVFCSFPSSSSSLRIVKAFPFTKYNRPIRLASNQFVSFSHHIRRPRLTSIMLAPSRNFLSVTDKENMIFTKFSTRQFGSSFYQRIEPSLSLPNYHRNSDNNHNNHIHDYHVDTIYSVSSGGNTKSGVAVIRVSGPHAKCCLERITQRPCPEARYATLRKLICPKTGLTIDKALVLWFPSPRSFTGEDCVEYHIHGSKAVIAGLFDAFSYLNGQALLPSEMSSQPNDTNYRSPSMSNVEYNSVNIRPAERGEFTRRAYENGKMDLTEVEGLADLLQAETSSQRTQALNQMDGKLKIQFEKWREILMRCLAHTEAVIDFGDDDRESDIDDSVMFSIAPKVRELRQDVMNHLNDNHRGELIRDGIRIALVGRPNAGKSSLLNVLAGRPAAIVSPTAGTTRDVVEVSMDLGGYRCIISDTAGLRDDSTDLIELEGMKRARSTFKDADIKIFIQDASDNDAQIENEAMLNSLLINESPSEDYLLDSDSPFENEIHESSGVVLVVNNKVDLRERNKECSNSTIREVDSKQVGASVDISCATGHGILDLETLLINQIRSLLGMDNTQTSSGQTIEKYACAEHVLITRHRHREHLKQCVHHIDRFLSCSLPMDAAAEELRLSMQELGKVTGAVDVERLLDIIFRDFCIGK